MTRQYCVIGFPVEHSLSPAIYNPLFKKYGIDARYGRTTVKHGELPQFLEGAKERGLCGFNATMPHKEDLMGLVKLDESALFYGSVNTVVNRNGSFTGYSTDGEGFVAMLKAQGIDVTGQRVLIAGSGGAASSVSLALARNGAAIAAVLSRKTENAKRLADNVNAHSKATHCAFDGMDTASIARHIERSDMYVNCTPLGMVKSERDYEDFSFMDRFSGVVCDLVYMPRETTLLREARKRGLSAIGGIGMLIHQGLIAFELYTGIKADEEDATIAENSIRAEGYDI